MTSMVVSQRRRRWWRLHAASYGVTYWWLWPPTEQYYCVTAMPAHEECNQTVAGRRSAVTLHSATVGLDKRDFVIWYREQPTS